MKRNLQRLRSLGKAIALINLFLVVYCPSLIARDTTSIQINQLIKGEFCKQQIDDFGIPYESLNRYLLSKGCDTSLWNYKKPRTYIDYYDLKSGITPYFQVIFWSKMAEKEVYMLYYNTIKNFKPMRMCLIFKLENHEVSAFYNIIIDSTGNFKNQLKTTKQLLSKIRRKNKVVDVGVVCMKQVRPPIIR